MTPLVPDLSNHLDFPHVKGWFRRFTSTGLQNYRPTKRPKLASLFDQLRAPCLDAAASGCFIERHCVPPSDTPTDLAFSYKGVGIWLRVGWRTSLCLCYAHFRLLADEYHSRCLSWCQNEENIDESCKFEQLAINIVHLGIEPGAFADLPHETRTGPIEPCFRGLEPFAKVRGSQAGIHSLGDSRANHSNPVSRQGYP